MATTSPDAVNRDRWPTAVAYCDALRVPAECLLPTGLKGATLPDQRLGRPIGVAGKSAVVFRLLANGNELALRTFLRDPGPVIERCAAIDEQVRADRSDYLVVPSVYQRGLLVDGLEYPAQVMSWVDGRCIDDELDHMVAGADSDAIDALIDRWIALIDHLQRRGIAHGDIQHGNIIIRPSREIALVDLDAIWLAALDSRPPSEKGHEHFQHPRMTVASHWGPRADSFPALVVLLGLLVARDEPEIWMRSRAASEDRLMLGCSELSDPRHGTWTELASSTSRSVREVTKLTNQLASAALPPDLSFAEVIADLALERRSGASALKLPGYLRSARVETYGQAAANRPVESRATNQTRSTESSGWWDASLSPAPSDRVDRPTIEPAPIRGRLHRLWRSRPG